MKIFHYEENWPYSIVTGPCSQRYGCKKKIWRELNLIRSRKGVVWAAEKRKRETKAKGFIRDQRAGERGTRTDSLLKHQK